MGFREGLSKDEFAFTNLPFLRLLKVLDLRGENCLQNAHFISKKGPVLHALWTGSIFPLLIIAGLGEIAEIVSRQRAIQGHKAPSIASTIRRGVLSDPHVVRCLWLCARRGSRMSGPKSRIAISWRFSPQTRYRKESPQKGSLTILPVSRAVLDGVPPTGLQLLR